MFNSGPSYGEAVGSYGGDPLYHAGLDAFEHESLLGGVGLPMKAALAQSPLAGPVRRCGVSRDWQLSGVMRTEFAHAESFSV